MDEKSRLAILGTALILLVVLFMDIYILINDKSEYELEYAKVVRVIDGDTVELDSGQKVRLICIDAPEIFSDDGKASKEYLEYLVLDKNIILERDVSDRDEYGRLLRYVFTPELFINQEIVRAGYASVYEYGPDTKRCVEIGN